MLNQIRRRKWTWIGHTDSKKVRRQHCPASTPVDVTWPQRKRTTKEHSLEERSGDVDSGIHTYSWRRQDRTELEMEESGVIAYVPLTESDKALVKYKSKIKSVKYAMMKRSRRCRICHRTIRKIEFVSYLVDVY